MRVTIFYRLVFALVSLVLLLPLASANFFVFDDFELPVSGNVSIPLVLAVNESMFFTVVGVNDSRLSVSFPESVFFGNVSSLNVTVNFTVHSFLLDGNESFNFTLFINNSYNLLSTNYTLSFLVVDNFYFVVPDSFSLYLLDGFPVVNVSDNLLPFSGFHDFIIRGLSGRFVNVSCPVGSWLVCPEKGFFNSSNLTSVVVDYVIPENVSVGETVFNINFSSFNDSVVVPFTFNVLSTPLIVQTYVWDATCFSGDYDTLFDCIDDYEDWSALRLSEVLRLAEDKADRCEPKNNTVKEYVVVGDVDKDLYSELETCRENNVLLSSDYNSCRGDLDVATNDYETSVKSVASCQSELLNNRSAMSLNYEEELLLKDKEIELAYQRAKKRVRWGYFSLFLVISFLVGAYFFVENYKKNNWGFDDGE